MIDIQKPVSVKQSVRWHDETAEIEIEIIDDDEEEAPTVLQKEAA